MTTPETAKPGDPEEPTGQQAREVELLVLSYLKKKGYSNAEEAFKRESSAVRSLGYIMFYNRAENSASAYEHSYTALRDWCLSSLDLYRSELMGVLYPIFIHCYLDLVQKGYAAEAAQFLDYHRSEHDDRHAPEIRNIAAITTSQQMEENEAVKHFRRMKYSLKLSRYSFELLINFLQEASFMLLLSIVNQYLNIRVFTTSPDEEVDSHGLCDGEDIDSLNAEPVHWGVIMPTFSEEKKAKVKEEPEAMDTTGDGASSGVKPSVDPKRTRPTVVDSPDVSDDDFDTVTTGQLPPEDKSIPLPETDPVTKRKQLEDIRKRISVSSTALPSICFFTFLNTNKELNTLALSADGGKIAAGFSNSSIRLYSIDGEEKPAKSGKKGDDSAAIKEENGDIIDGESVPAQSCKVLLGHSGPVYSLSFSPDKQFLLSASEDGTARLWSAQTQTNLVAYKGHNYPIWDIDFSPLGYYFATASHDRTARLWSTDRIFPLRIFAGHLSDVDAVKFHPNCNYVATGSSDKSVRLWEAQTGSCVRILSGHYGAVHSLAFSPDGRSVASGAEDGSIIIWDIGSGKATKTLNGHWKDSPVWSLAYSQEGTVLASGGADQTVRLWDARPNTNTLSTHSTNTMTGLGAEGRPAGGGAEDSNAAGTPATGASNVSLLRNKKSSSKKSAALLQSYPTKKTPVYRVQFTHRNLLLGAGVFSPHGY